MPSPPPHAHRAPERGGCETAPARSPIALKALRHLATGGLRRRGRAGFSLAESMVCAVVTVVICLLVAEMSGSLVGGVSTASGRVNAVQKLELLRTTLGDDLARLPRLEDGTARLSAEGDEDRWQLTLVLPARPDLLRAEGRAWERVRYVWEKERAVLYRQRELAAGGLAEPEVVCPGVLDLKPEWLAGTAASTAGGPSGWDKTRLPAFLRLHPQLTEVWEEGQLDDLRAEARHVRDFEVLLPVSGDVP